jgi:glycolate oxidase FAD binding subunit
LPSVSEISSVSDAAETLRQAAGEGTRVSIGRDGGDVVLSTSRLDQVLEHEAGDLTCIVEAGVRVRELNERLAGHGQMLALDPPGNPTIGACLAANLSGPWRHRYGTPRDLVIGVTVVLGDGTVASSGGKVVKNVAGYDLAKLFCGSEGRLGLVARVALRLHPRPEKSRTLVAPVESPEDAGARARSILRSPVEASAVDVLWPGRLAVRIEGSRGAVDHQFAAAQALVGGEEDFGSVWEEAAAQQADAQGRLLFAPGELEATLREVEEAVVRVSAGVAYVAEPVPDPRAVAELALVERIRAELDPAGVFV